MLPSGSGKARGHVTNQVQDNGGNSMEHANPNPILESRQYVVEFEDSNDSELTANDIAQSVYAQYDPDGNQYLMLDSIVDLRRITTTLYYNHQNFVKNRRTYSCRSTASWELCCQWRGHVTNQVQDNGGNPMEHANPNPILEL